MMSSSHLNHMLRWKHLNRSEKKDTNTSSYREDRLSAPGFTFVIMGNWNQIGKLHAKQRCTGSPKFKWCLDRGS